MPEFAYRGRNAGGELVAGVLEAPSSGAVADQLFSTGITPVHIDQASAAPPKAGEFKLGVRARKIGLSELMVFCRQLHTLLKAGVPIVRTLAGLQESSQHPELKRVIGDVREKLEAGQELSLGMSAHPRVFSPFMVNMVRVGELTGRLDEIFMRLYEFFAFEKKIGDEVRGAMRYPITVVCAVAVALFIVNIFVIPAFAKMFTSLKAQLPLMTRILMWTSEFVVSYWLFILVGLAVTAYGFRAYVRTGNGRLRWDSLKLRLPIVGSLINKATLAKFSRSFALAGNSGVPIVQALSLVANVVGNAYLGARILGMREGIERGESVLRTATGAGVFDALVLQMVAVGEETGEMNTLMSEIADMYEREVALEVEGLAAKAEPILLVVMGSLVLVLALGVFMPMWDMVSAARGK
ncbi:MAG: type II secretion system F family protein [Betaproteobacteria bacterium]|nr:MAG: type II secretion system F family protein [Betaproteobacteria bacterium]